MGVVGGGMGVVGGDTSQTHAFETSLWVVDLLLALDSYLGYHSYEIRKRITLTCLHI